MVSKTVPKRKTNNTPSNMVSKTIAKAKKKRKNSATNAPTTPTATTVTRAATNAPATSQEATPVRTIAEKLEEFDTLWEIDKLKGHRILVKMKRKHFPNRQFSKEKAEDRNKLRTDPHNPDRKCCICLEHGVVYAGAKPLWQSYGTGLDKTWCHWRCRNDVNSFKSKHLKNSNKYLDEFFEEWDK